MQASKLLINEGKRFLLSIMFAIAFASNAQVIDPDRPVTLSRVDPLTGKIDWNHEFPKALRPTRCEVYTNRIVVFLYDKELLAKNEIEETKVVFIDSRNGRSVDPFDTRIYNHAEGYYENPEIVASELGPLRQEISLTNGWRSYGVLRLHWIDSGSNLVHFFNQRLELMWTLPLTPSVHSLTHWNDVLIHSEQNHPDRRHQDDLRVTHLFGQIAGTASPAWEFVLPKDIPSQPFFGMDVIDDRPRYRNFSYAVGRKDIYACGNGWLFALNPSDGRIHWRHCLTNDAVISQASQLDEPQIIEANEGLILVFGNEMMRFDIPSMKTVAVLRGDVYAFSPTPIYFDGAVYGFRLLGDAQRKIFNSK
jgi:hypothetical protein